MPVSLTEIDGPVRFVASLPGPVTALSPTATLPAAG